MNHVTRREFIGTTAAATAAWALASRGTARAAPSRRPNLVYVFADQLRAQATGYAGDPNLRGRTPNLDRLAAASVNFSHAVSTCPVCTPYRACLLTGRYPLSTGMFLNDLTLPASERTLAEIYRDAGYDTGYIGKWHLDGHGRSAYIPPERRQGFDYWKVLECTHDYNRSFYYEGNDPQIKQWDGYDVIAQTADAAAYIRSHAGGGKPFVLILSWGTPHDPYLTAPPRYRDLFPPAALEVRPNVAQPDRARRDLSGYYAHIAALDEGVGRLLDTLAETGLADDTIFVFTSDHGDMLGSQGEQHKQLPWDESVRVPFLLRYPAVHGTAGRVLQTPLGTPDILPTLLDLSGLEIPGAVEGESLAGLVRGGAEPADRAVLIMSPSPFRPPTRREFRGIRTRHYTYVRDLKGPWLMYDNEQDPFQRANLVGAAEHRDLQQRLNRQLDDLLAQRKDAFLPGAEYIRQWGHTVNANGAVPYH